MRKVWSGLLLVVLPLVTASFVAVGAAEDFPSLVAKYRQVKAQVRGAPKDREARVKADVAPLLLEIGKLDSDESLSFLLREMEESDASTPEVAAACPAAILQSSKDSAVSALLKGFSRRSRILGSAILDAMADSKKDFSTFEKDLVGAAQSVQDAELKKLFVPVLSRLDSLAALKALISQVQSPRGGKADAAQAQSTAIASAFKASKNEEIKTWLAKGAFRDAGSDPWRLVTVLKLVAELGVEDARGEVEKLAGHPSPDVAAAATGALSKLGVGDDTDALAGVLEKPRQKGDLALRVKALDALAQTGSESALEIVLRHAKGKDPEMKAIAIGSLRYFKDNAKANEMLVAGLADPDPSIRAVTMRALESMREKFMIGVLIDVLARPKEEESVRVDALKLLVRLTNQNMGLVADDWRKWWELAEPRFEFPKEGEKGGFTDVRVRDLSYFGIEIASKRMAFVIDVSSSMTEMVAVRSEAERKAEEDGAAAGTTGVAKKEEGKEGKKEGKGGAKARKIDILKKELVRVLQKLPPDAQINIIKFHATFEPWQKQLQPLAGPGRAKAIQYVQNLQMGTGTNVFDTLESALKDRRVDTIYILTDGLPTRGRIIEPGAIVEEIGTQNRVRGATIHCIAFGEESDLLKQIAEKNGGQYRFVDRY